MHPGYKYSEDVECEGANKHRNHLHRVCELWGSEWTTEEEEITIGYAAYPDLTSNILLCPSTPNDELNESDHLTAYPNPTSPFTYDDIDTLHCDYENGVLEAIESMRAINELSDDKDYQLYCSENEERRCHSPTPSLSTPHVNQGAPQNPQAPGTEPIESTAAPADPLGPHEWALGQAPELPLLLQMLKNPAVYRFTLKARSSGCHGRMNTLLSPDENVLESDR